MNPPLGLSLDMALDLQLDLGLDLDLGNLHRRGHIACIPGHTMCQSKTGAKVKRAPKGDECQSKTSAKARRVPKYDTSLARNKEPTWDGRQSEMGA
uniref:Uncharacterized protein n=1 Tax=Romanomermis culicivorax TaxID=13658 RepID=A0A915KV51_ROMCU